MTSPPKQIAIECPRCGHEYRDWHRPSINLGLDDLDPAEIEEATTVRCPQCGTTVDLDSLFVECEVEQSPLARREAVADAMERLLRAERDRLRCDLRAQGARCDSKSLDRR